MAISCWNLPICNIVPGDRHDPYGSRDDTEIWNIRRRDRPRSGTFFADRRGHKLWYDCPGNHILFGCAARRTTVPTIGNVAKKHPVRDARGAQSQRTYSMTILRFGSVPVEWVVILSISCSAAWMT